MTTTASPGKTPLHFDLGHFTRLAGDGDPEALPMLQEVLELIERGLGLIAPDGDAAGPDDAQRQYAQLAEAVATLFASPGLELSLADCDWLAFHNRHLAAIFRMAWPDGPDRVSERVRNAHGDAPDDGALRKVLAASGVAASDGQDWRGLLEREPETALPFFLANFTHRTLLDPEAERRRDALFALAPLVAEIPLRASTVPVLSEAWMLCSYARAPDRHNLKIHLNGMVQGLLAQSRIPSIEQPEIRKREDRPTIVVVAEVLFARHAMYKTYAHFLGQLRARFRLVLVTMTGQVDETAAALFDETFVFDPTAGFIKEVIEQINQISPAMIYYPSVGMSFLTVLLCNLRLAPIQIVSTGHPATTQSPEIDTMIMGHEYLGDEGCFSEQVMLLRSGGALFEPETGAARPKPEVREKPEILRVAVPASPMKINAWFLDTCRRVAEKSGRAIEYWFFPDVVGLRYVDCGRQIVARLPDARVYPRLPFADYLDRINQCDVRFGTYPFGGANTSVDAFRQGLPTLVFEGPEPHSRTDKRFIHLFGLPEWLIARSEDEFEKAALRLLTDDEERSTIARQILDADPEHVLFEKEQSLNPTNFVNTVWWLYENLERVKKSGKRSWTWEDRQAFDGG